LLFGCEFRELLAAVRDDLLPGLPAAKSTRRMSARLCGASIKAMSGDARLQELKFETFRAAFEVVTLSTGFL
jgi:hypothetical protein